MQMRELLHLMASLSILSLLFRAAVPAQSIDLWKIADSVETSFEASVEWGSWPDSAVSLGSYLRLAAERNPALRAAFYRWKSQLSATGVKGALPDPVLSYRYFLESVETRVGPQNQGVSLRQEIPWPGRLWAESDMANEESREAYRKFQAMKLEVFARVKTAYYEYYYLGKEIGLTQENLTLLRFWESVVRTKYQAALKGHPDLLRVQVELGTLEDRLATLRASTAASVQRLRAAINLPDSIQPPLPSTIEVTEEPFDADSVKDALAHFNPDLQSLRHAIAREEAGVRLAHRLSYPTFSVGVDFIATGPALDPATPGSGKDPWIVGVSVTLPLWLGKNASTTQEAEARHYEAEFDLEDARNTLMTHLEERLFAHGDALRKLRLYRDGLIPKAVQSLNTSYTAYQAGEVDFLNVLDAQRRLLEFQLERERARAQLGIQTAAIEALVGVDHRGFDHPGYGEESQ